ncbi:MAG: HlyD family type I secretion periplasmic adaptor subunit [Hydrogenophaga sp.]|uniref:HlyD family type I secretion periplasmic adaptor subunit n=1 Tax=Hydrogenophaga sp. TaxID=1904254 RepID=UPI003D9AE614
MKLPDRDATVPPTAASNADGLKTDARSHARLGWWIVLAGIGGFLLWASLAPLDQGVPMGGTVTVAGNKKAVQHLSGGTVEAILVKEGDTVKEGQTLVRMNGVQANANAEVARVQLFTTRCTEARLQAERDGLSAIVFPPDVLAARSDPRVAEAMALQEQLWNARQSALRSELAAIDENMAGLQAFYAGLEQSREGKQQQMRLLKEQVDSMRDLARDGFVPRNRLLDLERGLSQIVVAIADDTGSLGRTQRQIGELKLRRLQRQQDYQKEVRTLLADTQKEAGALKSRLEALDYELANALVKSPVDGVVADVNVFTEGGVVAPGLRMMDILPSGERLIVEGQIPVHLIDSVHPDLPVELIFSAFNHNTTPRVPALVTQVSPDRLVDEKTGVPYYRLRAEVTPAGQHMLADLQVRAGMPVELFVKTGERTLMNYLLRPLRDHIKMALTEE